MKATAISGHALKRFKERSGIKRDMRAVWKMFHLIDGAIPLSNNRAYYRGWIVVIKNGEVMTAYRPKTREEFDEIYSAKRQEQP